MLVTIKNHSVRFFIIMFLLVLTTNGGYAQNDDTYRKQIMSLNVQNETLQSVLDKITNQAHVQFFFNHSLINLQKKITLNLKDRKLEDVLSYILGDQNVTFEFQSNRTIVLKPVPKNTYDNSVVKISGTVIDAVTKEPLVGASIVAAEKKALGVVTDGKGSFFIEVPSGISALNFSFVGYQSETLRLIPDNKYTDLSIKLSPQDVKMDDVVVTGMAPRKVDSFSGSYMTVKGEKLKQLSPNNILKALQIFDPSFRIVENNQRGSDPNTMPEFHLRGNVQIQNVTNSGIDMLLGNYANRPNMPLFILDGFETSLQKIVDLDPERIESVTILKDASATAIYGSRAATGVVVFETKKPLPGALNVSYSANFGISVPDLSDYNMMNAAEKLQYEFDAGLFSPTDAMQMNYYNHYKSEILKGVNTYWLSAPLRTAIAHRHTLSMEGGDEALRYNMTLNHNSEPGVMKGSDRRVMGLNLNLQYRRKKWNVGNQLSLADTKGNNSPYGSFGEYTNLNPYYRKTDINGKIIPVLDDKFMGAGLERRSIKNPLYNTQFPSKDFTQNFNVTDNFSIEYAALENLRLNAQVSFTKGIAKNEIYKSKNHTDFVSEQDLTKKGSYNKNSANSFSWSANTSVNYNLTLDKNVISLSGRWSIDENKSEGVNLFAKGFPNDNMNDFLFAYHMEQRVQGSESTSRSMGLVGQMSYMYDYKYAADFSIRGDLSSNFGENTKMAPFWSAGMRWNMHKEKIFENTAITNMVLRGSYGITGSQNYSPYQSIETYTFNNLLFPYLSSDVLGAELRGFGNSDLGWSKTTNRSVSMEFGLWDNRFNVGVSYYNNTTDALLLDYNISPSSGFPTIMSNAGAVENIGYDLTLSVIPISNYKKQIQWSLIWNGSHNRNRIKKISNMVKKMNEENLNNDGAPLPIYEEGKSMSQLFAVRSLGIDPATGKEIFLKRNGQKTFIWNAADKVSMGDTEPTLRGSISSSLTWKNFNLSLAFAYEFGGDRYNSTLVDKIENANVDYNLDRRAAQDRWRKPNDVAKYKSMSILGQQTQTSSRFIEKFNELRFSALSVGYRFDPKHSKFMQRCHVGNISINGTIEDLCRFSTMKQERGLDYPFARSLNLSLSVLFN